MSFLNDLVPDKLTQLDINNNLFHQNIVIFNKFENLSSLSLSGNSFYGNLKTLRNLNKLEELFFTDNKIDGGLEYLPSSLKDVTLFSQELTSQDQDSFKMVGFSAPLRKGKELIANPYYDFRYWKESQPYFK